MTETALHDLSVREIGRRLRSGTLTSEALTRHLLARIHAHEPQIHAFIALTEKRALEDARRADRELASGHDRGPLHGIPLGIKDIYDTAGIATTCGSQLRKNNVPEADSEVARRLREAGTVLLGKLNTSEFAMAGPSFDLPAPPARNPWDTDRLPSGSSSGSGASIAARYMRVNVGTDTTGSIRDPAGVCGIVGLKPTYGLVSARGVFPLAYSLDHCGPFGRTVDEAGLMLGAIAGHDPADPASVAVPAVDYLRDLEAGVKGLRIAWPRRLTESAGAMPQVVEGIARTVRQLAEAGAVVEEIELPEHELFYACADIIMCAEAFELHAENMRARAGDYGLPTMRYVLRGAFVSAEDYIRASRLRRELADAVNALWGRFDALIGASNFSVATPFEGVSQYSWKASQHPVFNISGGPSMSVPVGLIDGLPTGAAIGGAPFNEAMVLRVGRAVERLSAWEKVPLPELP